MGFLDNILNLIKFANNKKIINNYFVTSLTKLRSLNNIGNDTPNCPYCNIKLKKFPARKTKCKNCGEYMYVRTRPIDYKKVLLKEKDLDLLEEEWEKRRYINNKQKAQGNFNPHIIDNLVIDASSEMEPIIQDLITHYKDYCSYNEILHIDEKDRLPILKYIWNKWMVHSTSIERDLKYNYPQYNFRCLKIITFKEHKRIMTISQSKQYKNLGITFVEYYSNKELNYYRNNPTEKKNWVRICYVEDMPNVIDVWYTEENYIDKYTFFFKAPPLNMIPGKRKHIIFEKEPEYVELWENNKIKKMGIEKFYEYCENNNIDIIISF